MHSTLSYASALLTSKLEQEWCSFHHLVQSSLHDVGETYEVVMGIMHRFRPMFLCQLKGPPSYYNDYEFKHTCFLSPGKNEDNLSMLSLDNEITDTTCTDICVQAPYVDPGSFNPSSMGKELTLFVEEIRSQCAQLNSVRSDEEDYECIPVTAAPICKFFVKGVCNKGCDCLFSHSPYAKPELCKYYLTLEGCRYGDNCRFSHDFQARKVPEYRQHVAFEDEVPSAASLLQLLPKIGEDDQKCILLFGESDFNFASNLALQYEAFKIIVATMKSKPDNMNRESPACTHLDRLYNLGVKILWNTNPIQFVRPSNENGNVPWSKVQCVLWTVTSSGNDEEMEIQKGLIKQFFAFLAIRFVTGDLCDVRVILTMYNSRYAQLQMHQQFGFLYGKDVSPRLQLAFHHLFTAQLIVA
eukprot:Gb_19793 [translate_table: standard]